MRRRHSKNQRARVRDRWPHCAYCRLPYAPAGRHFTIDHLLPLFRGGSGQIGNLVGCCNARNVAKGCRTPEEGLAELMKAVREIQRMQLTEPSPRPRRVFEPEAVLV